MKKVLAEPEPSILCDNIIDFGKEELENEEDFQYKENGIVIPKKLNKESNFLRHAEYELKRAELFDKGSDYDGMIGKAVMDLVKVFSCQGHSGGSAGFVISLFEQLAKQHPIGDFEPTIKESRDMSSYGDCKPGEQILQSVRKSSVFSRDGGRTWYDLDNKDWSFINYGYTGKEVPKS